MRHYMIAIFLFLLEMQNGNGFELVANSNQQDEFLVGLGKTFHMECTADSHYEYCIFEHEGNEVSSFHFFTFGFRFIQIYLNRSILSYPEKLFQCEFEWKRSSGKVELQIPKCSYYHNRIEFSGNYDKHVCGMKLENVNLEDEGKWSCELEEYRFGGIRGNKAKMEVELKINSPVEYDDWQNRESGNKRMDTETISNSTNDKLEGTTSITTLQTNKDLFVTHNAVEGIHVTDPNHSLEESTTIGNLRNESMVSIATNDSNVNDSMSIQKMATDDENDRHLTPVIITSCLVVIFAATIAMLVLHFTGKLSTKLYNLGGVMKRKREEDAFDTYLEKDAKSDIDKRY